MIIEDGKTYLCKNGEVVTVRRSNLPYYKFGVLKLNGIKSDDTEVWSEDGIAYHDDCGYNFVKEIKPLIYSHKLVIPGRGTVCVGLLKENGFTIDNAVRSLVLVEGDLCTIVMIERRNDDDLVGFVLRNGI